MLEKTITIGDKQVKFRSSATIPRLYRAKFKRDIFKDLSRLESSYKGNSDDGSSFEIEDLEIFENVAYIMAYHADHSIPATIEEWLDAAEYIMSEGNYNVVLCERGIRTFETATRNTLDVSAVPVVKERSSLPIIIDPSHAAGKERYVSPLALAGIAAGADGLIVEVHPNAKEAISDAAQQLSIEAFADLVQKVGQMANIFDREM